MRRLLVKFRREKINYKNLSALNTPSISVLVTSYNREKYIEDCLTSVLASTYQNYEVIVLDDASSDNTVKIAKEFEKRDTRVNVVVNEKNLGQFANRNKAAALAKHDYIKFFDSDDIMYSHCLEVYARAIEKHPDAGLFAELQSNNSSRLLPCQFNPYETYVNHYWKGSNLLYIGPSGTMYNKRLFNEVNGINESLGILADTHLSLKLASISSSVGIARDTFYWRIHSEQVTEGQNDYVRMIKERYVIDKITLKSSSCPLKGKELEITVEAVKKRFGRNIIKHALKFGDLKVLIALMKSLNFTTIDLIKSIEPNFKRL